MYFNLHDDVREAFLYGQLQAVHVTPLGLCVHDFIENSQGLFCLLDRWLFQGRSGGKHRFCDATDRAANQNIGNDRQGHCRNQQFQKVDAPVNDQLVDHVQNRGEKENLSNVFPSLLQQFAPVGRVPENCPEERPSILMCVPQPGTNREDRCNRGLYDQP
jgi:hypothetical protein